MTIGKWAHFRASNRDDADCFFLAGQRNSQDCAHAETSGTVATLRVLISLCLQVGYMDRPAFDCAASCDHATHNRKCCRGYRSMMSDKAEGLIIHLIMDRRIIGIAKAGCARSYLCEHTLQIHRRT